MRPNRLLAGAVPVAAFAGGLSTFLLFGSDVNRSVTAQGTTQLSIDQRNVATSLEAAFMQIAENVGPAAVSIEAEVQRPASTASGRGRSTPPRSGGGRGEERQEELELPFGDLFAPPGGGGQMPFRFPPGMRGGVARGSGVIVRADGYILTNDHVVENARDGKVKVTLSDGSVYSGTVLRDARSDLAVVKINADKPLPFVRLADSDTVRVGQWAIAIGSPWGQQNTVTTGIVSALHRRREISDGGTSRLYPNLIQTDASINPGNSGGPLLNINGELVGVNVAIFSPSGVNAGIGYAIPANSARYVMEQLIAKGKVTRGSLGVVPSDVPVKLRQRLGTASGAYIEQVFPNTPADKGGIEPGDVVVRFGDRVIRDEAALRERAAATAPGTKVDISLMRSGKPMSVAVTLTEAKSLPEEGDSAAPATPTRRAPALRQFGFEARPLTAALITESKLGTGVKGVHVEAVLPGSPAFEAGLAPGDVVVSVNGAAVTTVEALDKAMQATSSGDVVTLSVLRNVGEDRPGRAVVNIVAP